MGTLGGDTSVFTIGSQEARCRDRDTDGIEGM